MPLVSKETSNTSTISSSCGRCLAFLGRPCGGQRRPPIRRKSSVGPATEEDFRSRIEFLAAVPLFARMPRAEYPMLARVLKIRRWESGEVVFEAGSSRAQFFLISDGWAEMSMNIKDEFSVRLQRGDYFGDAMLTERLPGKVVAGRNLVTLSMSANEFKKFGVARFLRSTRRRAVGRPGRTNQPSQSEEDTQRKDMTAEQRTFVTDAVRRNAILRSLVGLREEVLQQICNAAQREEVSKGTAVYRRGDFGGRFYIVESGSFCLRAGDDDAADDGDKSPADLPSSCAKSEMSQRMLRKEHFLQQLIQHDELASEDSPCHFTRRATLVDVGMTRTHSHNTFQERMQNSPKMRPRYNSNLVLEDPVGLVRMVSDPGDMNTPSAREAELSFGEPEKPRSDLRRKTEDFSKGFRRPGDSFGEMALLYHAPRPFTAWALEDSAVWSVDQDAFRKIMANKAQNRSERVAADLDKVALFQGLLSHEKLELAESFSTLTFKEGDYIVRQGEFQNLWYILVEGECAMISTVDDKEEELATLRPVHHFGERALLRGAPSEFSLRVLTKEGARCLVLDGPTFKELGGLLMEDTAFRRAVKDSLVEFARFKDSYNRKLTGLLDRLQQARGPVNQLPLDPSLAARALDRVGLLGVGAFGTVTLEKDPSTGKLFALKTMSKGLIQSQQLQESVKNERAIMTMIDSPFLLRLHATSKDENYVYLLLDPMLGGDLHFLIRCPETSVLVRRPNVHKFLLACVACGLEHLHERNVVFRDLKSENVLLASNGYAKLCDFGFAKFVLGRTMTLCGTPEYVAPEVIQSVGYDRMADWWAFGILTFEAICGDTPFVDPDDDDPLPVTVFQRIMRGVDHMTFFPFDDPDSVGLVKSLLQSVPSKRLGIGGVMQVKRHAFFAPINFTALGNQELEAPYIPPLQSEEDLTMFDTECQEMPQFIDYIPDGSDWDADF